MAEAIEPTEQFRQACDALGFELSDEEIAQHGRFLHLLLETNRNFNLTAVKAPEQAWMRHILDSLSLLPFLADAGRIIDVGTGGGLPGIPLAIAQPERRFALMDSTGKKIRFVEEAARQLGLDNVQTLQERAETAGQSDRYRERFDAAIGRAIGPMNVLLELTLPLVRVGGRVLAMKGAKAEEELKVCGDALMTLGGGEVEVYDALPGIEEEAVVVIVEKIAPTPTEYPRRPGIPKQEPL